MLGALGEGDGGTLVLSDSYGEPTARATPRQHLVLQRAVLTSAWAVPSAWQALPGIEVPGCPIQPVVSQRGPVTTHRCSEPLQATVGRGHSGKGDLELCPPCCRPIFRGMSPLPRD